MTGVRQPGRGRASIFTVLIIAGVLGGSLLLGMRASPLLLGAVVAAIGTIVLLIHPALSLPLLVVATLIAKIEIPTGTAVFLNPATVMIPALTGIMLIRVLAQKRTELAKPRVLLPIGLFLISGLISLMVGWATWDPFVPRRDNLLAIQLAQMALYLFAFLAFWLTANLGRDLRWLKWMTATILGIGGVLAIAAIVPFTRSIAFNLATVTLIRASFWTLLAALSGGQLLFNKQLTTGQRLLLGLVFASTLAYAFVIEREAASNWVGVGVVMAILAWLRFRRIRWLTLVVVVLLLLSGLIFPTLWNFAGGEDEWIGSGQSRLVLIERVISVAMRNPITGLGPVAYRSYAGTAPLAFGRALWVRPEVNSHNNYVDIFAQFGLVGLGLFVWLVVELGSLGIRLLSRYQNNFAAGYVRGMLAAGAGSLVIMMLADWILPFVYNIGFHGFQASILIWLFLGGLAALDSSGATEPIGGKTDREAASRGSP